MHSEGEGAGQKIKAGEVVKEGDGGEDQGDEIRMHVGGSAHTPLIFTSFFQFHMKTMLHDKLCLSFRLLLFCLLPH